MSDALVPSLALPDRPGIPDEIAVLRARFAGAAWDAHPNYGGLARFWRGVHAELRREGADLAVLLDGLRAETSDPASFGRAFVPTIGHHLQHLDMHHRVEDVGYFPRFRALDPDLQAGFDLLEADHHLIHAQLEAVVESANGLLQVLGGAADARARAADTHAERAARLLALLDRHLDDEEDLVIPALLQHGEHSVS